MKITKLLQKDVQTNWLTGKNKKTLCIPQKTEHEDPQWLRPIESA